MSYVSGNAGSSICKMKPASTIARYSRGFTFGYFAGSKTTKAPLIVFEAETDLAEFSVTHHINASLMLSANDVSRRRLQLRANGGGVDGGTRTGGAKHISELRWT